MASLINLLLAICFVVARSTCGPLLEGERDGTGKIKVKAPLSLAPTAVNHFESLEAPVYIIPMFGVHRSGKSMTLNRLMGLQAPYDNGFGVGHSASPVTQGIDFCDEKVKDLGTIVWMDTEGLFSSKHRDDSLDKKVASFAVFMSSVLLLNSRGVLDSNFFDFFGTMNLHVAVLENMLMQNNLMSLMPMTPTGIKAYWIQSQPHVGDKDESAAQFKEFLDTQGEWKESFLNEFIQIPSAVDGDKTKQLEKIPDKNLRSEYKIALRTFRNDILQSLNDKSRVFRPTSIVQMMKTYLQIINEGGVDTGKLVAMHQKHYEGMLCRQFADAIEIGVTELELEERSKHFEDVRKEVLRAADNKRDASSELFNSNWVESLSKCMNQKEMQVVQQSWKTSVKRETDRNDRCYVLDAVAKVEKRYIQNFKDTFELLAFREHARDLQSTKLQECVTAFDLWPLALFLLWPAYKLIMLGYRLIKCLEPCVLALATMVPTACTSIYLQRTAQLTAHGTQMWLQAEVSRLLHHKVFQSLPWALDCTLSLHPSIAISMRNILCVLWFISFLFVLGRGGQIAPKEKEAAKDALRLIREGRCSPQMMSEIESEIAKRTAESPLKKTSGVSEPPSNPYPNPQAQSPMPQRIK